jgi:hypothetical protein
MARQGRATEETVMAVPQIDRHYGVPAGHESYRERITRTIHPDGTITDSDPLRVREDGIGPGMFQGVPLGLMGMARIPAGTQTKVLERTVTTTATAWVEVPTDQAQVTDLSDYDPDDDDDPPVRH